MYYRQLGKTDLNVSIIGFGAGPLGNAYGEISDDTGKQAVHAAIDHGINFFDTSPYYGLTLSETRLGHALKGYRQKVLIATKGGRYGIDVFDFSATRLIRSVEESLQRLQTDVIDLYQLHDVEFVSKQQIIEEALPCLERLRKQGKIRYIGITGYPLHLLRDVAMTFPVDSILSYCHYNLLNTTLQDVLVPLATKDGIGLINASSLHMGVLTEQGAPPWHPGPEPVHEAARQAATIAREYDTDITTIALQFALQNKDVNTTLVGMRTEAEVHQNLALIGTAPDQELLARIQEIMAPVKDINWESGLPENYEPDAQSQREKDSEG
ncbi:MAG: aldo/keto reductase [Chloroflexi bacterium]|nr:aldo/keto reductase [Chloroflexota bacterium]